MGWGVGVHGVVSQTVEALGMELVEIERLPAGLLRVSIDWPWQPQQAQRLISVDDCEQVSRQLQYVLEVEGTDYARLEVSSPGIDRLLRSEGDLQRFAGETIDITLKEPLGANASGLASNRKKFRGVLEKTPEGWQIVWSDAPAPKPGQRVSKKKPPAPVQALGFVWDELREARLAAIVDFKRRRAAQP